MKLSILACVLAAVAGCAYHLGKVNTDRWYHQHSPAQWLTSFTGPDNSEWKIECSTSTKLPEGTGFDGIGFLPECPTGCFIQPPKAKP